MIIEPIPAFADNYIWLLQTTEGSNYVVDPGDSTPVLALFNARGLTLNGILITHWHPDHTGGIEALKAATGCTVWGPHSAKIDALDQRLSCGDTLNLDELCFTVIGVPGHTLDHIAYFTPGTLFCGDTLFVGGCGRVFEGSYPMMRASLEKLKALPADTHIYCAHEYTLSNLRFALTADPDNATLQTHMKACEKRRQQDLPTVPSTLAIEIATNPFLRCEDQRIIDNLLAQNKITSSNPDAVFEGLRSWKDIF